MKTLKVTVNKLNTRKQIPSALPNKTGITGTVAKGYTFEGEEVKEVPNPALGTWYKDSKNIFYWGGGLEVTEASTTAEEEAASAGPDNTLLEHTVIAVTPVIKRRIEQVINVFETGSATGNYATLVKLKDYRDPVTKALLVQITFGRSQTTEFGYLKTLVADYVADKGVYAPELSPYVGRIGKQPSLATDETFCNALKLAGKNDPIMKTCQDHLFEVKYYQPAYQWFTANGFRLPLSMLVIYDSMIHSGSILPFLRKKFPTVVPASGGNEKQWITNYVQARHNWLENSSNKLLRNTVYRTNFFMEQIKAGNWELSGPLDVRGIDIS